MFYIKHVLFNDIFSINWASFLSCRTNSENSAKSASQEVFDIALQHIELHSRNKFDVIVPEIILL